MDILVYENFSNKIGDRFQLVMEGDRVLELVLSSADLKPSCRSPQSQRDPFSLIFNGTKGTLCRQAIYRMRHASGWEIDIFLVPLAHGPDGTYTYQAIYT